jgi:Holliday junction resolvase RusA-like endonuclease
MARLMTKTTDPGFPNRLRGTENREWTLALPYLAPPLTLNQRMHWAPRNRITQEIKQAVYVLAHGVNLPQGLDRVTVTLHWRPATTRKRDNDNISPTLKAAVDGLVMYGLVQDDNTDHLTSATVIDPTGKPGRVYVIIRELTPISTRHGA